jgi:hypothetical protein
MMHKRLLVLTLLAITVLSLTITAGTYAKSTTNYDRPDPRRITRPIIISPTIHPININPTIQFVKYERSQSGVIFYYQLTAGTKQINWWLLESPVFGKTPLLGTSESKVDYNQHLMYIKFNTNIDAGQTKLFWFDLGLNYDGFKLGCVPYHIQEGGQYEGMVDGPLFSSSYTLPHW